MYIILKIITISVLLLFAGCSKAEGEPILQSEHHDFKIVTITDGLNHPWSLTFLPSGDYLVSERNGTLWRISPAGDKTEITGVVDVYHRGQGGLLDITPEPNFQNGGWLYYAYAAENDEGLANTEVARARLDLENNRLTETEIIFRAEPKVEGSNHWGSRLLFALDGTLYITLGERFDYKEEAQNPHNHLGTIVRVNPDGSVPEDNPFNDGEKGDPKVFTYGNRNVQGIALHPTTGEVWAHEHGTKGGDEVNILEAGANYGWPDVTFGESYWGTEISDKTTAPGMKDPVLQWTPSIAPSGMAFYNGNKFPAWQGDLFVGALAHRHLRRLELDGERVVHQEELLTEMEDRIRDVRQGPQGYLYVLTDESNGELIRLEPI